MFSNQKKNFPNTSANIFIAERLNTAGIMLSVNTLSGDGYSTSSEYPHSS